MSYHRQIGFPSNYAITPVQQAHHSHHSANKENISLHSQIFQRLHAANSQNKPNQLKPSQTMNTKKCLSPIKSSVYPLAKAFAQSNGPNTSQPHNPEVKDNRRSNCATPPEIQGAFGAFNEETDIFENRFKSFGEEIQQIKEIDETSSTGSNNLDGINNDIILVNGYNPEKRDSEVTKTLQQIQEKITDVNEQYKQLTQKISEFQNINEEDSAIEILNQFKNENQLLKGPARKNENSSISRQKEEDFLSSSNLGSVRSEHRLGYKLSLKPQNREIRNTNETEKKKLNRSGHEKSTSYSLKKKELESKAKLQKDFEKKSKELMSLEEELRQREDIIQEKENLFKSNEKAFEKLTQELEDQSEKLAEQKIDFSNKVEMFNLNMHKFQEEKEEFSAHVIQKNNELKVENERLQNIRNEIQREQKMLDEKCREILKGYSDYNIKKTLLEKKEEETLRREKSLKEESDHLDAKRLGFLKDRELVEKELKTKEERLIQWEQSLAARKIAYDEYDLKLMSMKLNEEMWQKKRNIEVVSLQEKIKFVKNKENELQKKEEKLNKMMEEIRKCKDHIKPGFESPKALDPEQREDPRG